MPTAIVVTEASGQVVHLPAEIHLASEEVFVKQVGHAVVLVPKGVNPWQPLIDSLDQFSDDFMTERDQPVSQQRGALFE